MQEMKKKLSCIMMSMLLIQLKIFLLNPRFFGDRNILIIKTDKTIPTKELDSLIGLCAKNDSSYFIYQYFWRR